VTTEILTQKPTAPAPLAASAADRLHLRVLRDNLIDADAEVDQIRRDLETAQKNLEAAIARRDDWMSQLEQAERHRRAA
jgi:hypothetical protein